MTVQAAPLAAPAPASGPVSAEALFAAARRRRRRRWLVGTAAVLVAAIAVTVSAVTWPHHVARHARGGTRPAGTVRASSSSVAAVWFDGVSLHVASIEPGGRVTDRVVAQVNADALPLLPTGGRVYWVDPAGTFVPALGHWSEMVQYLDVATGRIGTAGPGQTVFLSADGRDLFMSQTATSLTETPVTSSGAARQLALPRGWYLPGGDGQADLLSGAGLATANGIVVQSQQSPGPGALVLGLWKPGSSRVTVIGRARAVIDAYTPPGARYSLLAWLPAGCCALTITNTATLSDTTVRSPLPGGFAMGGAFSPAGQAGARLAVFLNGNSANAAQLALVDPATGTMRVAARPRLALGVDIAWARWLPDGTQFLVGPAAGSDFLVNATTLSAEPLVAGINYTTAVVPLHQ